MIIILKLKINKFATIIVQLNYLYTKIYSRLIILSKQQIIKILNNNKNSADYLTTFAPLTYSKISLRSIFS